jgi:hypothetical protein
VNELNGVPASVTAVLVAVEKEALNNGSEPFVLEWTGSKVPRGFKVNGVEIGWTQHGIVTGVNREMLGTYTRTKEWGGPDRDEHAMRIVPSHGPWCNWLPNA